MVEPQYPVKNQGKFNGYQIPNFFIEKGLLSMWSEIKSGNITYDFRYQNGNFELINVKKLTNNSTKGYTDENTIFTEMNFDLVKGIRTETDEIFGSEKPLVTKPWGQTVGYIRDIDGFLIEICTPMD